MAVKGIAMSALQNLVILIPGFFGFRRLAGFYYFEDRVIAALRGALEAELTCAEGVPVVPVANGPTDSLAVRQQGLLDAVGEILRRLQAEGHEEVKRIHLVGHSTGGLDAHLLLRERSAAPDGAWEDPQGIRARIASVVTISAPLRGSSITLAEMARGYWSPTELRHWPALAEVVGRALRLYAQGLPVESSTINGFLEGALADPAGTLTFLRQILLHRDLIQDLRPAAMAQRLAGNPRDRSLPATVHSFVTVGVRPLKDASDPLYTYMHEQIAAQARLAADDAVRASLARLQGYTEVRRSPWALARRIERSVAVDPRHPRELAEIRIDDNDGVVDSARQLLTEEGDALAGVVLGDHADVLGRYDNIDHLIDDRPQQAGTFHSGAIFSDDTFFKLYRDVAKIIATRPY